MRVALLAAGALVAALAGCTGSDGSGAQESSAPGDQSVSGAPSEGAPDPAPTVTPVGKPNGVETLDPQRILKRAERAALGARSVRIAGGGPDASLDLVVTKSASDGERTSAGVTLRTRVVDGTLYIKADESYWGEAFSAKKAKRIGDKWVTGDLDNPRLKTFRQTGTLRPLLRQFLSDPGQAEAGEVGSAQGQPAVPVSVEGGTMWVATTGKPFPLLLTGGDTEQTAEVTFQDWNKKVVIKAPPKKNTISLADLA